MEREIQSYRQALTQDPTNREAFEKLERLYVDAARWQDLSELFETNVALADWERLIANLELLSEAADDKAVKSEILHRVGEIWEVRVARADQAMISYQKAFKTWPANTRALAAARAIYSQQQNWKMVLTLFQLELKVRKEPREQARIYTALAALYFQQIGDEAQGMQFLGKAVELDPENPDAQRLLDDPQAVISGEAGSSDPKPEEQAAAAAPEADAAAAPEAAAVEPEAEGVAVAPSAEEVPVVVEAPASEEAAVEAPASEEAAGDESEFGRDTIVAMPAVVSERAAASVVAEEGAVAVEVAEAAPQEVVAEGEAAPTSKKKSSKKKKKAWEEEVDRLVSQAEAATDSAVAGARYIDAIEKALASEPDHPIIGELLDRALAVASDRPEVLKIAINLCHVRGDWARTAALMEKLAEATPNRTDRVTVLGDLAQIYDMRLGDNERAVAIAEELLKLDPTHPGALKAAEAKYSASGDWEKLVEIYDNTLKKMRRKPGEIELLVGLANMVWKRIGDIDRAEGYYKRLKLADAKNTAMLDFYCDYYREKQDWKRLLTALQNVLAVTEDPRRKLELSFQMAAIAEHELANPEKAIDVWKQALRLDSKLTAAREALAKLYERTKKWNALLELIKEDIAALGPDDVGEKVALYERMVEIYRDQLRLDVMVINTYIAILEVEPENTAAMDALAERYEQANRWNDLQGILQKKAAVTEDKAEAVQLYWRIADLWRNRLTNTARAIEALETIVALDPMHAESIRELHEMYEKRSDWAALFGILQKEAMLVEGEARVAILEQAAELADKRLRNTERAIEAWEAVSRAASDPSGALAQLESLYTRAEDWTRLVDVHERMLEHATTDAQRVAVLDRMASVHAEHLEDEERAVALWRRMLPLEGGQAVALPRITRIYTTNEAWDDLVALYKERGEHEALYDILDNAANALFDEDDQVRLYQAMADLAERELGDDEKVVAAYEAILGLDPTHVETARALLPYYRKAHQPEKEAEANQIILAWTTSPAEALDLIREIGRLYEDELSNLAHAFDWYGKAVRKAPQDEALRAHFEDLAARAETQPRLVETYKEITEGGEALDDDTVHALWRTVARVCWKDLGDLEQSVAFWERVLEVSGDDAEAIAALETLYEELSSWEKLLAILDRRESLADGDAERVALSFKRARILLEMERFEEAARSYVGALDVDPTSLEAVRGLKQIHARQGDWPALAEILQRELELVTDERAAILIELGDCYMQRLDDPESAIGYYSQLLSDEAGAEVAVERLEVLLDFDAHRHRVARLLEPVYRSAQDWPKLAENLEIRMEELGDPLDRCELLWELFELRHDRVGNADAAFDTVVRIFGENYADERAWDELERLADVVDAWDKVVALYEAHRPDSVDAEETRFALLRRLARIYEAHTEARAEARAAWELMLQRDGEDSEAIARLEEIYTRSSAHAELVGLFRHKAGLVSTDDATRKRLYFQMATLLEGVLDDPAGAIDAFRQVLLVDQTDLDALNALKTLYETGAHWDDLVELLRHELSIVDDPAARNDVRFKLGQVLELQIGDADGALEAYSDVLLEDRDHLPTREAAESLLVGLAGQPDAASLRQRLTRVLEPIYVAEDADEKLVELLRVRLGDTEEVLDRVELNTRIARLLRDRLNDLEAAFVSLCAAVREDFSREDLRQELEQLADVLQTWEQLIALYQDGLGDIADGLLQREIRFRTAQILETELGATEQAIAAYDAVLELDDTDREALDALERLHEANADWTALISVLTRKADLEVGEPRVLLLRKVAIIEDDALGSHEAAIKTWSEILASVEGDADALAALDRLYTQTQQWDPLVEILEEASRQTNDPVERRAIFFRMASLHEEKREDANEAILLFHRALDLDPEDGEALDALDRLYATQERHADLGEILERKLQLAQTDGERNELEYRLGQLYQQHLMGSERAIEYYRSILQRDFEYGPAIAALRGLLTDESHRFAASRVLEPIYEMTEEWQALVEILDLQLLDTDDPVSQVELLRRIATLRQTRIGDAEGAFVAWASAMTLDPSGAEFRDNLEALADVTGDLAALSQVYKEVLVNVYDPPAVVSLRLRVAEIARQLGDLAESEAYYLQVLEVQEDCDTALTALELLYFEQERWDDLLGIRERRLDFLQDSAARLEVIFQNALIHEEKRDDHLSAIESYRRVLEIDESNAEAIGALKRLYAASEAWLDLVEVLTGELRFASSAESIIAIKLELAAVYRDKLGEDTQAVQTYREILEIEQAHPEAVAALESMFDARREALPIAQLLEPIYRASQSSARLVGVLAVREEESYDAFEKAELLLEILQLLEEHLGQPEAAFEVAGRLFLSRPADAKAQLEVKRLALALGQVEQWAALYQQALESDAVFDFSERKPLMLELASIRAERLGDHAGGRQLWEEVLLEEPTDAVALERLEWSYTQNDEWQSLIELYERRVELTSEPADRLALLFRVALIREEVLGDPDGAVAAYSHVLDHEPEDARATRALERLFRSLGRFEELAQLYTREMDFRTEVDEQVELQHRLGTVLERELGRIGEAVDAYRTALELKPEHPASRRSLETLLRDLGGREEDDASAWRVQIATLLVGLYDEEADWEKLVDVYEVQLEQVDDPSASVEILIKQARLFEKNDRTPERAFRANARAVELSPSRSDVREDLERLAGELGVWADLVPIYVRSLDACDGHDKVEILLRIAQLNESELHNSESATVCYQEILSIDPGHAEALDALERLYTRDSKLEPLVEVLYAKAEITNDVWERKDILYRVAEIWETLEKPTEAIETYRRILEVVEEDQTALDALETLYQQTQQWESLVDIYRRKIDLADDSEERLRLQHALATLHDENRQDAFEAIEAFRAILMDHPRDLVAIGALDRLYQQEARWVDLLDILQLELELASEMQDADLVDETEFRIGHLLQTEMHEVPRAIEHYRAILERTPSHDRALTVLEALLENPDHQALAADVLEPQYQQLGRWEQLVDLNYLKLEQMYDPVERRELMLRTAQILEDNLDKPEMAFMLTGRTVREHPRDEVVIEHFERLAAMLDNWAEAVGIYEELVEGTSDPDLVLELSLRMAGIYETALSSLDEAIAKYQRVLEIDEYHRGALENLDRLYQGLERYTELAEILQRRIDLGGEREDILRWRFGLGWINEHHANDIPGAIECYKNIIWDDPSFTDALSALEYLLQHAEHRSEIADVLEPIYTQSESWAKLYELLQLRIEVTDDASDRCTLLRRMGRIARDNVQDDGAAFAAFALALELAPGDAQLIAEVEALAERLAAWEPLAQAFENAVQNVDDPFTRRELNLKIANLCLEKLQNLEVAEAKFREVLEAEPDNQNALLSLERIYRELERWPELLGVLEQRIESIYDEFERKQLLYAAAEVALNVMGDIDRGVGYLEQVLQLDDSETAALDALDQLFEHQGRYADLLAIVERKATLAMDGDQIRQLRVRIGVIARDHLDNKERAIEAFRNALDFDPSNIEILKALEDLFVATNDLAELQDNLMRQLGATEDQDQRLKLFMKCAAVAAHFGDTSRAIENLQQVLYVDPTNEDALAELERIFSAEGRFEDLRQVLEQQLQQASSDEERISLAIRIAQVAGKLGDAHSAVTNLQAVLELQPTNVQAMSALAGLYEDQQMYGEALEMLQAEMDVTTDPARRAAVLVRIGDILYVRGGDDVQGEEAYAGALQQDPTNAAAIDALLGLYEKRGDAVGLLRVMEYKVATVDDPATRRELLARIAKSAAEELGDYETAARNLEQVYAMEPDLDTAERLLDAYIKTGNVAQAQPLLDQIVQELTSTRKMKRLPPFHHMRGQLALQAGNEAAALEAFKAAYDIDATYLPNLLDLGKYYYRTGNLADALKTFQTMLLHQMSIKDDAMKVDMYYHLGMVRWQSGDERRARDMFNRALNIDAAHAETREALEKLG